MGNGYTRQSASKIVTGEIVKADPLNDEFNAIQTAFNSGSGHTHDGTTGEGPKISLLSSIVGILPVENGGIGGLNKLDATTNPTINDDELDGYVAGSLWVDATNDLLYVCVDPTAGAAIWVSYQEYSTALASISSLTVTANKILYTTGTDVYSSTALTPFARTILDDADAATVRTTLGLGTIATQASNAVSITGGTITNATITGGSVSGITDLAIADGGTGASTASDARTNLGLGTIATQNANSVNITGGTVSGTTVSGYLPLTSGTLTNTLKISNANPRIELAGADDIRRTSVYFSTSTNKSKLSYHNVGGIELGTLSVDGSNGYYNGYGLYHEGNLTPANFVTVFESRIKTTAPSGESPGFEMYDETGVRRGLYFWNYAAGAIQFQNYDTDGSTILNSFYLSGIAGGGGVLNGFTVVTTGNIGAAYGGNVSAGGVGSIQLLAHGTVNTSINYNSTYAGSALRVAGIIGDATSAIANVSGTSLSGTWRALGTATATASKYSMTIFLRIS